MDDLISREGVLNILQYFNSTQWLRLIKILPSAEAGLIAKIQNGIKAADADDAYSCGMRNGMRWCMSLIDDKEPLYENSPSARSEQKQGHWIVSDIPDLTSTEQDVFTFTQICRCSECGAMFGRKTDKYCYNCGARMEGGKEDE